MTLGVAHKDSNGMLVLDCLRVVSPKFDPFSVVSDFAETLKNYHISTVVGDKFTGEWCSTAFAREGIRYEASRLTKSEIYLGAEPLFNTGVVELLDNQRCFNELRSLERRTRRAGRENVDHPVRGSDDLANAACGALVDYLPQEVGHA